MGPWSIKSKNNLSEYASTNATYHRTYSVCMNIRIKSNPNNAYSGVKLALGVNSTYNSPSAEYALTGSFKYICSGSAKIANGSKLYPKLSQYNTGITYEISNINIRYYQYY